MDQLTQERIILQNYKEMVAFKRIKIAIYCQKFHINNFILLMILLGINKKLVLG